MNDDAVLDAVAAARDAGLAARAPWAFAVVEALARRAALQQGSTRTLLMQRLQQRLTELQALPSSTSDDGVATPPQPQALAALGALVDRLGRTPLPGSRAVQLPAPAVAPLRAVARFKGTWSRLRADQRLRQAMAQVPAMAGPLNSSNIVHRMLQAMREASPEYLEHFMAHVDALMWLEQASGGGLPLKTQRK